MHREQETEDHTNGAVASRQDGLDLGRLLDALPCGAVVLDAEQRILVANRIFSELLGYAQDALSGRTFKDMVAPEDSQRRDTFPAATDAEVTAGLRLRTERGHILNAVVRFSRVAPQNAPRNAPWNAGLVDAQGPVLAVVLEHRLGAMDKSRSALTADEAQAFAKVANWEVDIATGRMLVSRTWYDIWGFDPDQDLHVDTAMRHVHPADLEHVVASVEEAMKPGVASRFRFRIVRPDGSICWVESACRVEPSSPEHARTLSGVVLDITQHRAAEEALARYYDIVSASPDRIAFLDRGCRLLAANAAFFESIQRTREDAVGGRLQEICGPGPLADVIYRNLGRCLDAGHPIVDDIRETGCHGEIREFEVRLFPHRDDDGPVLGIVVNVRDVTSVRESERLLLQSAAVYAATSDGVMITDNAGRIVAVNAAFTRITGYAEAEVLGRKPSLLNSEWHTATFFNRMWRTLLKRGIWEGEVWNRRKDGEVYLQRLSIRRILDSRGKVSNFVGVFAERQAAATGRKQAEYLAHYDPLTKLPNRVLFDSRLTYSLDRTRRNRPPVALYLLDLDHFAHVNASLGHQIGDELLRAVGLRLRETIRPGDTLARLSGNQFGLILEGIQTPAEAEEVAQRLRSALRPAVPLRGHEVFVTTSIGIGLEAETGNDSDIIMAHAESALRSVKQRGRDGFRIFSAQPGSAPTQHQQMIDLLRAGFDKGEYALYFQPRVDLETGRWAGAEARVRWNQPELGVIPPERFLPLADAGGLMVELGQWMLAEALRQLRDWVSRGLPVDTLSVNISEAQLTRFDLVSALERLMSAGGLGADRLELEFAEPLLFKHPERAREVFNGLHRLGIALTVSDVGTSWLAPPVLRRLPIRRLKIHHSFVDSMPDSKDDLAIVQALIAMGQALDIDVLADGVRDDRQRVLLLNIGCLQAQGDRFAPPLSARYFEHCLIQVSEPPNAVGLTP
jgi:diguanylate cyclase (GGDEF)-like protein/PAS domain S-box-containing protein